MSRCGYLCWSRVVFLFRVVTVGFTVVLSGVCRVVLSHALYDHLEHFFQSIWVASSESPV